MSQFYVENNESGCLEARTIESVLWNATGLARSNNALEKRIDLFQNRIMLETSCIVLRRERNAKCRRRWGQVFSRGQDAQHDGLSTGWLEGVNHQTIVRGDAPKHRGVMVGELLSVSTKGDATDKSRGAPQQQQNGRPSFKQSGAGSVTARVRLAAGRSVKPGDGVLFDAGDPATDGGGSVWRVDVIDARTVEIECRLSRGATVAATASALWRTGDADVARRVAAGLAQPANGREHVELLVTAGAVGAPLTLALVDGQGRRFALEASRRHELSTLGEV